MGCNMPSSFPRSHRRTSSPIQCTLQVATLITPSSVCAWDRQHILPTPSSFKISKCGVYKKENIFILISAPPIHTHKRYFLRKSPKCYFSRFSTRHPLSVVDFASHFSRRQTKKNGGPCIPSVPQTDKCVEFILPLSTDEMFVLCFHFVRKNKGEGVVSLLEPSWKAASPELSFHRFSRLVLFISPS